MKGIEAVDRELVGPLLEGLMRLGSHRIVAVCDWGAVHHGQAVEGPGFFAYRDSAAVLAAEAGRRFTEADVRSSIVPPRDATKFVVRLFAKGS